jgi:acyl-CoA synthetase (AMP-forming)/AMP-acid ligase II
MIIADLVRRTCASHGPRTAVTCDETSLTYAELWDRSVRLVNLLRECGLQPGDRVATLGSNSLTSLEEITGLAVGGYVRAALHAMNTGDSHRFMLESTQARAIVITAEMYERFAGTLAGIGSFSVILVHDLPAAGADRADRRVRDYESSLSASSSVDPRIPVAGDDLIHLAFSSGSTGRPKASMHTHQSWMNVTLDHAAMLPRLTADDAYLAAAPLTHAASVVLYALLGRGARIDVMPHFEPSLALELIERRRSTLTLMVPTMLALLTGHPDVAKRDLSSLRAVMYSGAPISVGTARAAREVLGDILFQSYGQSECLPVSCLTPEDHALGTTVDASLLRSAGRPCLGASVNVVDDDGNTVPAGQLGEIVVHAPGRMQGIFNDPEATAARLTATGFVRTRDIGYVDERGYLFVVDRKDDMIISGGFNIWPAEIELALAAHPSVAEALVVGVPHAKWGETPHAIVVLREGSAATEQELIDFCKERIGSMKKPTAVVIQQKALPRTGLGKISRREVREKYWPSPLDDRVISGA